MADKTSTRRGSIVILLIVEGFRTLRALFWAGAAVAIVYFGVTVPVQEAAGEQTTLTLFYRVLVDTEMRVILPWATAGGFGLLWRKERRTRITSVARENRRNRELEKKIDRDRTSSGLVETGPVDDELGGA